MPSHTFNAVFALAAGSACLALPQGTTTTAASGSAITGNPFDGYQMYANPYYASEISASAIPSLTGDSQAAASEVAAIGTFSWLDTADKVPQMGEFLGNIQAENEAGASPPIMGAFVVYDLPDRDCAALASNGEYSIADGGVANYKKYVDSIVEQLQEYSDVRVALVIGNCCITYLYYCVSNNLSEPDSLANLVTNTDVEKCANAASAYKECVTYALENLNLPNVAMYVDAGHAGWLGWAANLQPAADLFAGIYKDAGSPAAMRGLATNVANYNAWSIDSCPSYTQGNDNCDEKRFINALAPLLSAQGFDAHFIIDQGRSGKQPTGQNEWGDWCNAKGTGFGLRPSSDTGDDLADAFVWIKPVCTTSAVFLPKMD